MVGLIGIGLPAVTVYVKILYGVDCFGVRPAAEQGEHDSRIARNRRTGSGGAGEGGVSAAAVCRKQSASRMTDIINSVSVSLLVLEGVIIVGS